MQVKDWMTTDLITVSPDTPVLTAVQVMKKECIRRLPVLDDRGALLGIITDRDLKAASPSKVTTMDMHEHHYLLGETKVEAIMTRKVFTVTPEDTVEKAAALMIQHKITGLPVVRGQRAVGILTTDDVARVLTAITGFSHGGVQFALRVDGRPGETLRAAQVLRARGGRVVSQLSVDNGRGGCQVYLRVTGLEPAAVQIATEELDTSFDLLYVADDHGGQGPANQSGNKG